MQDNKQTINLLVSIRGYLEAISKDQNDLNTSIKDFIKNTEKSDSKSNKTQSSSLNVKEIVEAVSKFDKKAQKNGVKLIEFLESFNKDVISQIKDDGITKFENFTKVINKTILPLSTKLALSTPLLAIGKYGAEMFSQSAKSLLTLTKGISIKQIENAEKGIVVLDKMSSKILAISGKMAILTPLALLALPGVAMSYLVIAGLVSVAKLLSKIDSKSVDSGITSIKKMSGALIIFSGALALSTVIGLVALSKPSIPFGLLTIMGVTAITFWGISKLDKNNEIAKASLGILAMSGSLAIFSLALAFSAETVSSVDPKSIMLLGASLAGIGLVYGLAGMLWKHIALGALAFAAVGVSLYLLVDPLGVMLDHINNNQETLWQLPLFLTGLGVVYGLAGAAIEFIALGAVSFGLIGGSLWVVGKGLSEILKIGTITEEQGKGIEIGIKSIITGFGKGFSELSLKEALTLPLKIPVVAAAAGALWSVAKGIGSWKEMVGNWNEDDSDRLKYTITSLTAAFSTAGSTEGMSKFLGFNVGDNNVERGIESTMKMGKNLKNLADGIMAWKNMNMTDDDIQLVSNNIGKILNLIPAIFEDIGRRDKEGTSGGKSLFGIITGADLEQGYIERGISSTKDMGENLKNLAEGIMAWKDMKISDDDLQLIVNNVSKVLNVIPFIFEDIGRRDKEGTSGGKSLFGIITGADLEQGYIERGISSTKELGTTLKDLSEGILSWKDLDPEQIKTAQRNIIGVLKVLPMAYYAVGKLEDSTSGTFSDGYISKGVNIINELTPSLKTLSDILKNIMSIPDVGQMGQNIGQALGGTIRGVFVEVTKIKDKDVEKLERMVKPLDKISKIFSTINKEMKNHFSYIASLDKKYLDNFAIWADSLYKISESGKTEIEKGISKSINFGNKTSTQTSEQTIVSTPISPVVESKDVVKQPAASKPAKVSNQQTSNLESLISQMISQMDILIRLTSDQKSELALIKAQLAGVIKTKEVL
jgi:hypothetical protein